MLCGFLIFFSFNLQTPPHPPKKGDLCSFSGCCVLRVILRDVDLAIERFLCLHKLLVLRFLFEIIG